jgi:hypothetical protein
MGSRGSPRHRSVLRPNGGRLPQGVLAAVNHSGDSDSTGSMCGNLLGAALGIEVVPADWVDRLAEVSIVKTVARDLIERFLGRVSLRDSDRYATW